MRMPLSLTLPILSLALLLLATLPVQAQRRAHAGEEPTDPDPLSAEVQTQQNARWQAIPGGLQGTFASVDERYPRQVLPELPVNRIWTVTAWRGERVHTQLLLWSKEALPKLSATVTQTAGAPLPIAATFVRYVRADNRLVADILDSTLQPDLPAQSVRPLWVSIDVPREAPPGEYRATVTVSAGGKNATQTFAIVLQVLSRQLPAPKDWSFYLDLWQNPYALARYHHVTPFSAEHLALMRPHLKRLADAGQKVLTTTILPEPWGGQTFDPYGSMVQWTRQKDGSWQWDYTLFDKYVAFGRSCGIGPYVNCYSMIPWTNRLVYHDAATGTQQSLELKPGEASYEQVFGPFLTDFRAHLQRKGWLATTRIAMDERPLPLMEAAWKVVHQYAPGLGIALAGDGNAAFKDTVTDWCAYLTPALDHTILKERQARGLPTTFYVCCNPGRPNTFTFSPPAESTWLGLYAAGQGYSGFLRWAFDSWTEDPLYDTKHVTWDAGDCFLVYPEGRSSIRFERLREGIQEYEKVRLLRTWLAGTPSLAAMESTLSTLTLTQAQSEEPVAPLVNAAKAAILRAAQSK